MARAKISVNLYAGRWKGRRSVPALEVALKEAGVDFDLVCTAGPDHACAANSSIWWLSCARCGTLSKLT